MIETPENSERERGKPLPDARHSIVEVNLGCELAKQKAFRVLIEVDLEINERRSTLDLSVYPWRPVDCRRDCLRLTEPPPVAFRSSPPTRVLLGLWKTWSSFSRAA
jgi:hypothetical protein